MSTGSSDPRAARSRDIMLAAARAVMLSEGPAAVTHQRVAQQAGVGRATVYRHWARPEQLLLDVMVGADLPFFRSPTRPVRAWLRRELRRLADQLATPEVAAIAFTLVQGAIWDRAIAVERDRFVATISDRLTAALSLASQTGELIGSDVGPGVEARVVGPIVYRTALEAAPVPDLLIEQLIDSVGTWRTDEQVAARRYGRTESN
jgi:AcrR family transcriptional regulator